MSIDAIKELNPDGALQRAIIQYDSLSNFPADNLIQIPLEMPKCNRAFCEIDYANDKAIKAGLISSGYTKKGDPDCSDNPYACLVYDDLYGLNDCINETIDLNGTKLIFEVCSRKQADELRKRVSLLLKSKAASTLLSKLAGKSITIIKVDGGGFAGIPGKISLDSIFYDSLIGESEVVNFSLSVLAHELMHKLHGTTDMVSTESEFYAYTLGTYVFEKMTEKGFSGFKDNIVYTDGPGISIAEYWKSDKGIFYRSDIQFLGVKDKDIVTRYWNTYVKRRNYMMNYVKPAIVKYGSGHLLYMTENLVFEGEISYGSRFKIRHYSPKANIMREHISQILQGGSD